MALVTLGGDGALIVTADAEEQVEAPKITVVDTIGAGDAFGGGFLASWRLNGLDSRRAADADAVREATRFACVVAARTCERAGASPAAAVRPRRRALSRGAALARAVRSTASAITMPTATLQRRDLERELVAAGERVAAPPRRRRRAPRRGRWPACPGSRSRARPRAASTR